MLNALNIKILVAILAVLLAIVGTVAYRRHEAEEAALERQRQYQLFRQRVEQDRKKRNSAAANEGKTWQKYLP